MKLQQLLHENSCVLQKKGSRLHLQFYRSTLKCNIVGVTCLFPSIFKALPSIHASMNLWGRRTAEPIRPFPNDRANEVRKRRTRRGHREPSALNVNGKDIIRVCQPSPPRSLSSPSILPLFLILSNVPSHLPQFPSLLLFLSSHSPLRVIPVPPTPIVSSTLYLSPAHSGSSSILIALILHRCLASLDR